MLHAGEGAAHLLDGLNGHFTPDGGGSGQQVLDVVQAAQLDVFLGEEGGHNAVLGHAEHSILPQERAVVGGVQAGKPDLPALAVGLHPAGDIVLVAQHFAAGRHLMEQDVPLGVDVLLHIFVVVEMVGRHVGHDGDLRALVHTDQLEAGQLDDRHILGSHLRQHGQQCRADVAAQMDFAPGGLIELGDQGGGGGLAVRAGHAHDLTGAEIKEELDLAGDHGTGGDGVLQRLLEILETGCAQDDILPLETIHVVLAEAQADSQTADGIGVIAKVVYAVLFIAEGHDGTKPHKLLDQGLVADTGTDEGNLFALDQIGQFLLFFLHKTEPPL